jgi:hypothetical protein
MFEIVEEEFVPKAREYKSGPRGPRARSEAQKQWDAAFEAAMNGKGFLAVQVAPEDAEEANKRVLSSCRLYERAVTEGQARPGNVKGTVILSWAIRVPKKRAPKSNAAETSPESPE